MNNSNYGLVLITSNINSVAVPIVDYLIPKGFDFVGILCEDRSHSVKRFSGIWWKRFLSYWIAADIKEKIKVRHRLTERINIAVEARTNISMPFNEFNSVFDLEHRYKIKVKTVNKINSEESINYLKSIQPRLGLSIASRILKPSVFMVPTFGTINLHSMTLPRFRGMSPVGFREVLEGYTHAKIHVHFIDETLDTGSLISDAAINMSNFYYDCDLMEQESIRLSKDLFAEAIDKVFSGFKGVKQPEMYSKTVTTPSKKEVLDFILYKRKLLKKNKDKFSAK